LANVDRRNLLVHIVELSIQK